MPTVFIPALLRPLIPSPRVSVNGRTIGQIIDELEASYPGVRHLLVDDEDEITAGIAVSINDQISQRGLFDTVPENAEVHFLPAISGG